MLNLKSGQTSRAAFWAGLLVFWAIAAFLGCGKKSVKAGDPNDPQFLATKSFVDEALVPTLMANLSSSASNQDGFSAPSNADLFPSFPRAVPGGFENEARAGFLTILGRPTGPGSVDSGYANGWHYFILDSTGPLDDAGTTGNAHLSDSVQFQNAGGIQQIPDSTTNRIENRALARASLHNGTDSLGGQITLNHLFQRSGVTVTFNGLEKDSLVLHTSTLDLKAVLTQTLTNIIFYTILRDSVGGPGDSARFDDCPDGGSVHLVGSITASGTDVPNGALSINFDLTITFGAGGTVQVVLEDKGRKLRWTYSLTGVCNSPV